MKIPSVDISLCSLCEGCVEVCPLVFRLNDSDFIEVAELSDYPEPCVEEAIKYCPEDCISWEEGIE
ncbi:MAG: ferredoxin [Thermodesulfobacteriota bacterium]|nr:ferredoxin [Thermodesulfobacteriota bacterium]